MHRYIPALLLALLAFAPVPLAGCGDLIAKLKGGGEDAGSDVTVPAPVAVDAAAAASATATAPAATSLTTATPTGTLTTVRPVVLDAGPKVDAGAAPIDAGKADSGSPAPSPTP